MIEENANEVAEFSLRYDSSGFEPSGQQNRFRQNIKVQALSNESSNMKIKKFSAGDSFDRDAEVFQEEMFEGGDKEDDEAVEIPGWKSRNGADSQERRKKSENSDSVSVHNEGRINHA